MAGGVNFRWFHANESYWPHRYGYHVFVPCTTCSPWRHLPSVYVDTVDKGIKMHNTILAQRQIFCLVLLFFYLSFAVFLCCHSDFDTDFFFTMAANKICFCFDPNEHEQIYQYGAWLFLLVPTRPSWRHELGIFMKHLTLDGTSKLLITIMRQWFLCCAFPMNLLCYFIVSRVASIALCFVVSPLAPNMPFLQSWSETFFCLYGDETLWPHPVDLINISSKK